MRVTRRDPMTGRDNTIDLQVTEAQIRAWEGGMVAQRAFPQLNADEREFVMTGTPPGEFLRRLAWSVRDNGITQDGQTLTAEAAEIGLPVGEWPESVIIEGRTEVFERRVRINSVLGELGGYCYEQVDGPLRLVIFND